MNISFNILFIYDLFYTTLSIDITVKENNYRRIEYSIRKLQETQNVYIFSIFQINDEKGNHEYIPEVVSKTYSCTVESSKCPSTTSP